MIPATETAIAVAPSPRLPATAARRAGSNEYLTFRVGAEEYAIDILRVQEIRGHGRLTRIAHAPDAVKGVINLRGVIVPVVDLRVCLQARSTFRDEDTVTIVLDLGSRIVGAVVDAVSDVLSLAEADIRPAPELGQGASAAALLGIATVNDSSDARRMLLVMDIERLLADAATGL
jgi:purine-binding chemotaxis protein CheW